MVADAAGKLTVIDPSVAPGADQGKPVVVPGDAAAVATLPDAENCHVPARTEVHEMREISNEAIDIAQIHRYREIATKNDMNTPKLSFTCVAGSMR
jgi:hypothetical protein